MQHQLIEPGEVLVGRSASIRAQPPFRDERAAVMNREDGVGVADIDREQHGSRPSYLRARPASGKEDVGCGDGVRFVACF